MAGIDYKKASAVIFDPVHVNLRTTRYALHEIGFREIESIGSLAEMRRRIDEKPAHLIVLETSQNEAEVFRLVRAIRSGEVGGNAFMAILLTCWVRDGNILKQAIGSVKAIEAPNTLKVAVEGDEEAMHQAAAWIHEAQQTVESERVRRLCMRIVVGMEAAVRERQAGRTAQIDFTDLERTGKELRMRLAKARAREACRVAQALAEVITSLQTEEGFSRSNLGLAKELAMGAYAAFVGGDDASGIPGAGEEIERTVEALRKRMVVQQQNDGGAEDDAELKRAAS